MVDSPDEKSVLVERLFRRQSEPVGVINLRQFQSQLARVPSWIVQRSRFLERWQSRYAFGESEPGNGTELMLATPVQLAEPDLTSQLSLEMSSGRIYQEKIAPPVEKVSNSQAGQTFRLSRKAVSLAADSNFLSKQVSLSEKIDAPTNTSAKTSPPLRTIAESVTVSTPDSKPAATSAQSKVTVAPKEKETKVTSVELKQLQVSNLSTPNPLLLRQSLYQLDEVSEEKKIDSLPATSGESTSHLRTITERINTYTSNSESAEISPKSETTVTAIEQGQSLVSNAPTTNPLVLRKNLHQPDEVSKEKKIDSLPATSGESTSHLRTITERINTPNSNSESAEISPKSETTVTAIKQRQSLVSNALITNPLVLRKNLHQTDEVSEEKKIDSLAATSGESTSHLRTITERINTSTSNSESTEISPKSETTVSAIEQGQSLVSNAPTTNPLVLRKNLHQTDEVSEEKKIDSLPATSGESVSSLRTITERINTPNSNSESAEISPKSETTVTAIEQGQSLVSNALITNPLVLRKNLHQPDEVSEEKKIDSLPATSGESTSHLRTITERINTPNSNSNSESAEISPKPETTVAPTEEETKVTSVELGQPQVSDLNTPTPLLLRKNLQSLEQESNRLTTGSGTVQREAIAVAKAIGGQKQSGHRANRNVVAVNSELPTTSSAVAPEIPSREVPGNLSVPTNLVWRKTTSEPARTVFSSANNGYTNSSLPSVSIPVNPNRPNILRQMSNTASDGETVPSISGMPEIAQIPNQTPVVNVADIAEQVSRLLFRQLTVERERRGMSQWY